MCGFDHIKQAKTKHIVLKKWKWYRKNKTLYNTFDFRKKDLEEQTFFLSNPVYVDVDRVNTRGKETFQHAWITGKYQSYSSGDSHSMFTVVEMVFQFIYLATRFVNKCG